MKSMSMFQVILLCVFGAGAIAGVLIFSLAIGGNASGAIGSVQIWGTLDEARFNEALRNASDLDQRLLTVTYVQKDPDSYMREITDALASGTGPDLFILRSDYALSQESRVMVLPYTDVSLESFETAFLDAASPFLSPRGVLGIPFVADPLMLYWNRDMLGTSGYSKPPEFWDELYGMAERMTVRNETGSVSKSAIAFGQYRNVNNAKQIMSMLILQAGGNIVIRNQDGTLEPALANTSSTAGQASVAALRFFTEFADPSKQSYSWNASLPEARKAFIAGDVGLYIGLASEREFIASANPNLNFSVASTVPQRRNAGVSMNAGHTYAFSIPRTSKNPSGARAVAFILAEKQNAEIFENILGIPSARRDLLQPERKPQTAEQRMAVIMRSWPDPEPIQTGEMFRGMIEDTVSGSLLPAEAVQRAEQQLSEALKPYVQSQTITP